MSSQTEKAMGPTYALVIFCHACVITALWVFGHIFAN